MSETHLIKSFSELDIPQSLLHRLEQMGFSMPTPIQAKSIPPALKGCDVLGSAQTGTGKTAAYGIPLVSHLMSNTNNTALVLLPTRELAVQVMQEFKKFIGNSKIVTALLIGGEDMNKQFRQLKAYPRLVIGTPGRVNDHLKRKTLKLDRANFLVLDEVDRMLDMGFGIQIDAIVKYLTAKRQTLMFSATLSEKIQKISNKYLNDPIRVSVGSTYAISANVKQEHSRVSDKEKYPLLLKELHARNGSILVFVKTKHSADRMAVKLQKLGHKTDALHGDLRQSKRNRVISNFRNQSYRVLVATDVAARGLDIPHIEHVINYDMPQNPEDYIHRIGRTARAGAKGEAINFLAPGDNMKWKAIVQLMNPGTATTKSKPANSNKKHKQRKYKTSGQRNKRRGSVEH